LVDLNLIGSPFNFSSPHDLAQLAIVFTSLADGAQETIGKNIHLKSFSMLQLEVKTDKRETRVIVSHIDFFWIL
jgi:hypothetical protein